ncbi:nuclear transport factor 2 family protein [Nocardia australiensis]|uniref:nuclear transport factor 2 family protein n=1 Tax=Nocardia australiensis TaxID=2887191 RepID=UPI001D145D6F|nr:nuclear transport factor 2 family protein [Nocardia australiensis]
MPTNDMENTASTGVLRRMEKAMNDHDLDALADCFAEDFRSDVPVHPARSFTGRDRMRSNWAGIFANVPDLTVTVLASAVDDDHVWSEWEMRGTTVTAEQYLTRGVAILHVRDDRITSVRFYLDQVDKDEA